jgi:tRNA(fMet)-specific endonuclease VapC
VKYLLDTDHISFLQRRAAPEHAFLMARMAQHPLADFAFSVVSFHEQALGAHTYVARARTTAELIRGYSLLSEILHGFLNAPVLPFDVAAGAALEGLRAQRVRLAAMDMRISAIALSQRLILLTRNVRDFEKVPGLRTEDWTK